MRVLTAFVLALLLSQAAGAAPSADIAWRHDPAAAFTEARKAGRPVFLYLEARWCHWCHVMQDKTFRDPAVQQALARHYVALKVDLSLIHI